MRRFLAAVISGLVLSCFICVCIYNHYVKPICCKQLAEELRACQEKCRNMELTSIDPNKVKEIRKQVFIKFIKQVNPRIYDRLAEEITEAALQLNKAELILAISAAESSFNPLAVSAAGARGLTQVRLSVWKGFLRKKGLVVKRATDLHDPIIAMKAANLILDHLISKYGLQKALRMYHSGKRWYTWKSKRYYEKVMCYLGVLSYLLMTSSSNVIK